MKFNIFFVLHVVVVIVVIIIFAIISRREDLLQNLLIYAMSSISRHSVIRICAIIIEPRVSIALKFRHRIAARVPLELERVYGATRRLQTRVRIRAVVIVNVVAIINRYVSRHWEHDRSCVVKFFMLHSFTI